MNMIDILDPCPCGTGINFENCCQPYLLGLEKPQTAETLLRSRYSAYVTLNTDYIVDTHHPDTVKELDKNGVNEWAKKSTWHGLEILNIDNKENNKDETAIEFIVRYTQEAKTYAHHETSLFKRENNMWYFFDVKKNPPIKKDAKVGRNDPCPCGSGKKFKKCCA